MLKSPSEESDNEARQQQNETKIKMFQVKVVVQCTGIVLSGSNTQSHNVEFSMTIFGDKSFEC